MVGVYFGASEQFLGAKEGTVVYMPAYNLLQLENKQFHHSLEMTGNTLMIVGGGVGLATATTRAAVAIATLEVAIGVGSFAVDATRDKLSQTREGRAFLNAWNIGNALIGLYSLGRVVMKAPQALRSIRDAYKAFKDAGGLARLDPAEAAKLEAEMQQMTSKLDEAEKATAGGMGTGEAPAAPGTKPSTEPPSDRYDAEAWKTYYEQNPNAGRSVGSASVDDPVFSAPAQSRPRVVTDIGADHEVVSTINPDGTVHVGYGDKSTTVSLASETGNNAKIARELGISADQAREVLQNVRASVGRPRKVLISFAQGTGNPQEYLRQRLRDPLGRWESDAFERPPGQQTRLDARIGAGQSRLSNYALVFEEDVPGQFTPKPSETTAVTEFQVVDPTTTKRVSGWSVRPRAVVRVNDAGEIVEILDHIIPGTPAEARTKLIALFEKQGWKVNLTPQAPPTP
jgi:hypothetical protein